MARDRTAANQQAVERVSADDLSALSSAILGRQLDDHEVNGFLPLVSGASNEMAKWAALLSGTGEAVTAALERAADEHLYLMHRARVLAVATLLPPASRILDLGGANAPLYDMGYPHPFEELIVVDLPPEDRHEEFAGRMVRSKTTALGPVDVLYADMADLSGIDDHTIDLVWSGQSIEHVTPEHARKVFAEVLRVLRPDGWFCLDTPNRRITALHAGSDHIHPDHKIEYTPDQLVAELSTAGFSVVDSFGICEMPLSAGRSAFDYRDFVIGAAISTSVDDSYIQFHRCRPAPPVQLEQSRNVVPSRLESNGVSARHTMGRIKAKAGKAMRRGRAALAQPPGADLVALKALVQKTREENECRIAELRELVLRLHSDAWKAAHVRNVDLDTLVKRLHVDAEEALCRHLDSLREALDETVNRTMSEIQREIAIDYESTIEALTYVARSLREVSDRSPGPSSPVA